MLSHEYQDNWIFSCEMLSRASWTTLIKVLNCAMLLQENYVNIEKDFLLCNVARILKDNIA